MMDSLIEIAVDEIASAGVTETTDFVDVDRAVAKFFRDFFVGFYVSDRTRPENREFVSFVDRDEKFKMYVGQFDDPTEFVTKLVAQLPDGKNDETSRSKLFPAVYLSRDPAISFCDGTDYPDLTDCAALFDPDGNKLATVNKSFAKVNYSVNVLAWDKSTLGRMALGLAMATRHSLTFRRRNLTATTLLANAPTTLNIELNIPRDAIGEAISLPFNEGRLNGISFSFEVITEVLEAVFVHTKTHKLSFVDPVVMENGGQLVLSDGVTSNE